MIGKKLFGLEPEWVKDVCLRGEQLSHAFVASVCARCVEVGGV
jgi:hypothetical protein